MLHLLSPCTGTGGRVDGKGEPGEGIEKYAVKCLPVIDTRGGLGYNSVRIR
jgi:hypothetical protein